MSTAARLRTVEPDGVGEWLRLAFFRAFVPLLLLAVAASEWAVVAWFLPQTGVAVPAAAHLCCPAAIWIVNRTLAGRRGQLRGARAVLLRGYVAVAFTSVFCGAFLGLAQGLRLVGRLGAVSLGFTAGDLVPAGGLGPVGSWVGFVDAGLLAIVLLFVFGYTAGRRALVVTERTVPVRGLPPALDGLRLVHVSDLHVGEHLGLRELAEHVQRVNALEPDLVCITGDLVDRAETCALAFPVLARLQARHGVLVTLGNHDVAAGATEVTAALHTHTRFTVLRDERVSVPVGDAALVVLGLDDRGRDWARGVPAHPALPRLARGIVPATPFLVLSHRPDCFPQAAALGAALMLSGHTHGGQLGLPLPWPRRVRNLAEFITAFDRGLYQDGKATLIVSCGLGFTGQPIRLFTPREVGCLTLRAV
jgi:predicted MPP superfamily phosphohydrolase